jgi:glycosyltransferase involved in cell wall biosynthesis
MKVLLNCFVPCSLAHGGAQIQIEQTKAGLEAIGVEVEFLRWWDPRQRGDLIHHFGTASNALLEQAHTARMPVVLTTLFTETCNRSDAQLARQGRLTHSILALPFGRGVKAQLTWGTYNRCAMNVVGLDCERTVLRQVYHVPDNRISIVPLGLSTTYLQATAGRHEQSHLICTGTITARKNSLELARMAHAAQIPILFVGKPYHTADDYWRRFESLIDNRWVYHHPHVHTEEEMISLLGSARGFVLMSEFENWCLSAHEAAACGLPLLVQDQKWSRERFGTEARYFHSIGNSGTNMNILKQFHADCPKLKAPSTKLHDWREVARQLVEVYEKTLHQQGRTS